MIYAAKTFKASLTLSRVVDVTCEKCTCAYCYQLVRRGTGAATAPYYIGQDAAKTRAQKAAMKAAQKKLANGVEPVACPECGWIQQSMVAELRRRTGRWLIWLAVLGPFVIGLITLMVASSKTRGFDYPISSLESGDIMFIGSFAFATLLTPVACIALWLMLRKNVNPNRAYPARPDIIPGAPPAARRAVDGSIEFDAEMVAVPSEGGALNYQRRDPDVLPGGWVTVQLLNVSFPRICSRCLKPTELVRVFQYHGNSLVKMPLPVCNECTRAGTRGRIWWIVIAGLVGAVPGALWMILGNQRDAGTALCLSIVFGVIGVVVGAIVSNTKANPARFRGYSSERNTLQVQFKNPGFTDGFRAANRAAAAIAVARTAGANRPAGRGR